MKVSIVTVCYNSAETIGDTIKSVLSQSYSDVEYIIIDGQSTDSTLDVVKKYKDSIDIIISEPDKGIYDAMNKGIALATGDVVGMLNSDDFYIDEFVIETVVREFENKKVDCVYADLVYVNHDNPTKVQRYYDSSCFTKSRIARGWMPAHPTLFVNKSIYNQYGNYKLNYKIGADFEIVARLIGKHGISYSYIQKPLVKMGLGGVSTSGLKSIYINIKEVVMACRENDIYTNWFMVLSKYPRKLLEIFKKQQH